MTVIDFFESKPQFAKSILESNQLKEAKQDMNFQHSYAINQANTESDIEADIDEEVMAKGVKAEMYPLICSLACNIFKGGT